MNAKFATGLDVLLERQLDLLKGQRVGLVSHSAAVTRSLVDNVSALLGSGVNLTALFGPEHGFAAAAVDGMRLDDSRDARTDIPIFSLYGDVLEPSAEMLEKVDVLVCDLQDVGVRFYTYLSTLFYLVRASGRNDIPLVVLDRPNPITGVRMDGPMLEPGYESFVGLLPILVRHGMTLGELALFTNTEFGFNADLTVIPMDGWERAHWFDQTGRLWVPTSPGIPHLETALVYPGICFVEGTNLSEGRGTSLPFELVGAPWLDGHRLAAGLNQKGLQGVYFRPASFTPTASKHQGITCHGVQLHILDRQVYAPLKAALEVISACRSLAPDEFEFLPAAGRGDSPSHFDRLAGTDRLRRDLESSQPVSEIVASWETGLENFSQRRRPYLLYD